MHATARMVLLLRLLVSWMEDTPTKQQLHLLLRTTTSATASCDRARNQPPPPPVVQPAAATEERFADDESDDDDESEEEWDVEDERFEQRGAAATLIAEAELADAKMAAEARVEALQKVADDMSSTLAALQKATSAQNRLLAGAAVVNPELAAEVHRAVRVAEAVGVVAPPPQPTKYVGLSGEGAEVHQF